MGFLKPTAHPRHTFYPWHGEGEDGEDDEEEDGGVVPVGADGDVVDA